MYLRELIHNPITMAPYLSILHKLLNVTCKENRMKKYKETLDARKGIQKGMRVGLKQNLKKVK